MGSGRWLERASHWELASSQGFAISSPGKFRQAPPSSASRFPSEKEGKAPSNIKITTKLTKSYYASQALLLSSVLNAFYWILTAAQGERYCYHDPLFVDGKIAKKGDNLPDVTQLLRDGGSIHTRAPGSRNPVPVPCVALFHVPSK